MRKPVPSVWTIIRWVELGPSRWKTMDLPSGENSGLPVGQSVRAGGGDTTYMGAVGAHDEDAVEVDALGVEEVLGESDQPAIGRERRVEGAQTHTGFSPRRRP